MVRLYGTQKLRIGQATTSSHYYKNEYLVTGRILLHHFDFVISSDLFWP